MKRLFTAVAIIMVVLLSGLTALIIFIDPNTFRAEITRQVERSSGYQVVLQGDLRWHIWPQLNILTGRLSVTAPAAQQPVLTADNLRIDVKLWPLLSHQLAIDQILLKGAVLRLTQESNTGQIANAPAAPQSLISNESKSLWNWDINAIKVVDGLLIWQKNRDEQINIRDLNLSFIRENKNQAKLTINSTISRDQRELKVGLRSELQADPRQNNYSADIKALSYQLQGANLPTQGIQGEGSARLNYQGKQQLLTLNDINLSANSVQLQGTGSLSFKDIIAVTLQLSSPAVQLEQLITDASRQNQAESRDSSNSTRQEIAQKPQARVTENLDLSQWLKRLDDFNANIQLNIDNFSYRDTKIKQLSLNLNNQRGKLTLFRLAGEAFSGQIEVKGNMLPAEKHYRLHLQPELRHVELQPLLQALNLPASITGRLLLQAELQHAGADFSLKHWQGAITSTLSKARLNGINIQQIIQQHAERSGAIRGKEQYERYTEINQLIADARLHQGGILQLSRLSANSAILQLTGTGDINLDKKRCDLSLQVRINSDWRGRAALVKLLSNTPIPLRIYGPWSALQYQVKVEQLLQDQLKHRGRELLEQLLRKVG